MQISAQIYDIEKAVVFSSKKVAIFTCRLSLMWHFLDREKEKVG